jgi:hypothetical protein
LPSGDSGLDTNLTRYFADLISLAQAHFTQVTYSTDVTPKRAILHLQAQYGDYRILVTELFSDGLRKYRYYVLREDWVEAGFDNSPDPQAIRLKYGKISKEHSGEPVPHGHRQNKTELSLTEEMTLVDFLTWLKDSLVA